MVNYAANKSMRDDYKKILSIKYQKPLIDIDDEFCAEHLGMKRATAQRKASEQALPFPTSKKCGAKSSYVVAIDALAEWMAEEAIKARNEWNSVQRGAA